MAENWELFPATGGAVIVTQLAGPNGQRMVELTALTEHDWPARMSLEEATAVRDALTAAIERRLNG
jgi:hypothetical protein